MSDVLAQPSTGQPPTLTYRRPTWQESVAGYAPPRWRALALRYAHRLPLTLIVLMLALVTLRLRNGVFIDEALYINAGQDLLHGWRTGTAVPEHGAGFSGLPAAYPVLIALVDAVGGLWLARFTSLVMVATITILLSLTTERLFGFRAGVLAAASFAATGPVIFLGALATFDALALLLLITGLYLGATRAGWTSAILTGVVLAAAVVVKYAAAVFVLPVLAAMVVTWEPAAAMAGAHPDAPTQVPRSRLRSLTRAAVAASVTGLLLAAAYLLLVDDALRRGIAFTTTAREALSPASPAYLLTSLALDIGPILLLAVLGYLVLLTRRDRVLLGLVLLGAAALLPGAQLHLGEAVSFSKHTAYSAAFLAPLAGVWLAWWSRRAFAFGPVVLVLLLAFTVGVIRSGVLHHEWVDVRPIAAAIEEEPTPGLYISSSTDALRYYTRRAELDIAWQTTFDLYDRGDVAIAEAVRTGRFQTVILRSASTGNPEQDAGQAVLLAALNASDLYRAQPPTAVRDDADDRWLLFHRRPALPDASRSDAPMTLEGEGP